MDFHQPKLMHWLVDKPNGWKIFVMADTKGKLNHVYWALDPVRRKVDAGLMLLDDGALACLSRFESLVKCNAAGVNGDGYAYMDNGHKADGKWVVRRLARMNPTRMSSVERNLTILKNVDEIDFDGRGRPYLKHWRTDKKRSRNSASEDKTLKSDEDVIAACVERLGWFLRSGEPRTVEALCEWMGSKLKKCPVRTMPRIVELLEAGGVLLIEDGVISVTRKFISSTPPASRPPPSQEPVEQEPKVPDKPETFPIEDIEPIAVEDYSVIPIEPIGGDAPNPAGAAPGTAPSVEGGGRDAGGHIRGSSDAVPVGRSGAGNVVREGSKARGVVPKAGRNPRRYSGGRGFDRSLSGRGYRGWVNGTHPHPRRTSDELQEFRSVHVHCCDLVDGMLYLAPDGKPPNPAKEEGGQESLFKYALGRINRAAGGADAADDLIRRELVEFVDDIQNQKPNNMKPFECDASVLFEKLCDLADHLAKSQGGG